MKKLASKIETLMHEQREGRGSPLRVLLSLLSGGYGSGLKFQRRLYRRGVLTTRRLPCKVVSIGNLVVGGTGKTPMTMWVARTLKELGAGVVIVSRGYRGRAEKTGGLVSDGRQLLMSAEAAGDEAFMMAAAMADIPVMVGGDRHGVGHRACRRFKPDVIVLDDGFQHVRLQRDVDLVLLDSRCPWGNGALVPRGTLREPPTGLQRSHAVILSRADAAGAQRQAQTINAIRRYAPGRPVFSSHHRSHVRIYELPTDDHGKPPTPRPVNRRELKGLTAFAFSGIANNDDFHRSVRREGLRLTGFSTFGDHHNYRRAEIDTLLQRAAATGADLLVTTEKDHARLELRARWPLPLAVVGIRTCLGGDRAALQNLLCRRLGLD